MSRLSNPSPVCEPSPAPVAVSLLATDAQAAVGEKGNNALPPASDNRDRYLNEFKQVGAEIRRYVTAGAPSLISDERSPQELSLREVETLLETPTLPQELQAVWTRPATARLSALNAKRTAVLLDWIEHELQAARHLRRGRLLGARLKTLVRQREIASRLSTSRGREALVQEGGYEIRLNLVGVDQPTWRLIQVPDMTLDLLSDAIRAAFEWDVRLGHCFFIHGVPFSAWRCAGPFWPVEQQSEDEFDWKLSDLLGSQAGEATLGANWIYQLGPWIHEVVVGRRIQGEAVLPHCLDGAGSLNSARSTALAQLRLVTAAGVLENVDETGVVETRLPQPTAIANPDAATFDVARTTTALRLCG